METEHVDVSEAPTDERVGNRQAEPKLPRHTSTLPDYHEMTDLVADSSDATNKSGSLKC